ncbi:MAG: hypothetical protein L3K16_06795 [Thermoplasmata archaeon]|nr:hypothetical protein [Thermoplasmata archaeon]
MSGELVRDRLVLGLLFVVGGSSLLWGLYLIFYISQTSPSGIFNTILGLLVLLITWAFLLPYALPAVRRNVAPAERRPRLAVPVPSPRSPSVAPTPPPAQPSAGPTGNPSPAPGRVTQRPPTVLRPTLRPRDVRVEPTGEALRPVRPAVSPPPVAARSSEDREIDEILAELPGPLDAALASESPAEVVRRLDALLRDLGAETD